MIRTLACILAFALGSCSAISSVQTAANSSPSPQAIADARTGLLSIESAYGAYVIVIDHWANQPRCGSVGAPPVPLCSTAAGVISLNKAAVAAKAIFTQAEAVVLSANPTQSNLSLAVSSMQAAWNGFQAAAAVYVKPTQ